MTDVLAELLDFLETHASGPITDGSMRKLQDSHKQAVVGVIVAGIRDLEADKPNRYPFFLDPHKPFARVVEGFIDSSPDLSRTLCVRSGLIAYAPTVSEAERLAVRTLIRSRLPTRGFHVSYDP